MNGNCSHNQEDLILHFYGELEEAQRPEIEARLIVCEACKHHYDALGSIQNEIPREPSVTLDDATLSAIRAATSSRLASEVKSRPRISLMPRLAPRMQWGMVAAIVLVSFFVGRSSFQTEGPAMLAGLGSDTRVSNVDFNSSTGQVQIKFDDVDRSTVEGNYEDRDIQSLLGSTLIQTADPASRLRTVRSVSEWTPVSVEPDESLVSALQQVLNTDTNDGIRLHALKALRALFVSVPVPESLKNDLITVLLHGENSAMRIEAMYLLIESQLIDQDMVPIMEAASQDNNPLIRYKADEMLLGLDEATPLEVIQ